MFSFVMMALGDYRFSTATGGFQQSNRTTSWRWASQEVIGAPPALQYIGPGEDCMGIEGVIYPHYRGGLGQCDDMRQEAGQGEPLDLVDGNGRYYGEWVIEKIEEGRTTFLPDGTPRKIEFKIELKRYY